MTATHLPFPLGHGILNWQTGAGTPVRIRHIVPEDAYLLVDLYGRLSPRTLELRFATMVINLPMTRILQEATRLATLNPENADALVALIDEGGEERIIAVARFAGATAEEAEFAMLVRDDFQGQGVGRHLFDLLVQVALVRGLKRLTATILAENLPILALVRKAGFPLEVHTSQGESDLVLHLD